MNFEPNYKNKPEEFDSFESFAIFEKTAFMPLRSQIALLFSCFIVFIGQSQNEVYIDEQMQELDSLSYEKKCKEIAFKCHKYDTDFITINKVLTKYAFGSITPDEATQLRKLLILDSGKDIKKDDAILVSYTDSLRSFKTILKNSNRHIKMHDSINKASKNLRTTHRLYTKNKYLKNLKKYVKRTNKCIKKYEQRQSVSVHYAYGDGQNVADNYKGMIFIKDRGILKATFFNIIYNYNLLLLKPDGDYFLSGGHLSDDMLLDLIKDEDWTKHKADWESTLHVYKMNGIGMFKEIGQLDHRKHCF